MGFEGQDDRIDMTLFELYLLLFRPWFDPVGIGAVNDFGDIPQMLDGMIQIENLHRIGEQFRGNVPNPACAIGNDHLTLGVWKIPARRFALDALCEGRGKRVGIQCTRGFNRRTVTDCQMSFKTDPLLSLKNAPLY